MAVTVTTLESWTEGGTAGKRNITKLVSVAVVATDRITATDLGFKRLLKVSPAQYDATTPTTVVGACILPYIVRGTPDTIFFADVDAPIASHPEPAPAGAAFTATVIMTVTGY